MFSKNFIRFYLIVFALLGTVSFASAQEKPEVKWKDGEKYIVHHIQKGETWSGLSRQYKIPVKSLQKINPKSIDLKFGLVVLIPYDQYLKAKKEDKKVEKEIKEKDTPRNAKLNEEKSTEKILSDTSKVNSLTNTSPSKKSDVKKSKNTNADVETITYKVQSGETLFGIAKKYKLNYNDLAKFNNLKSTNVKAGQVIKIPVKENAVIVEDNNPKSEIEILNANSNTDELQKDTSNTITTAYQEINGTIIEQGVATWLMDAGNGKNEKFYALHRSAPIGTIIKVKNPMTSRSVYVKVVGILPDTGDNHDVLIKVTQSAARRLGIVDSRFRVEISYKSKNALSK